MQLTLQGGGSMETKNVLRQLRESHNLTQDQMAERLMVTRQAVSRWENGETQPNTDTLRILSKEFNVSINTLLGSPRQLICQCCGMPLEDSIIGKNKDGSLNEDYCQWCYADGTYTYSDMDDLIDVCVGHMANENFSEEQARSYMKQMLPKLDYWKRYDELSDDGQFEEFKAQLIKEINDIIPSLPDREGSYGRFTKGAGYTLLAVLYLNADAWGLKCDNPYQKVVECCDKVMSMGYVIEPNFATNFSANNENSNEAIFAIPFSKTDTDKDNR